MGSRFVFPCATMLRSTRQGWPRIISGLLTLVIRRSRRTPQFAVGIVVASHFTSTYPPRPAARSPAIVGCRFFRDVLLSVADTGQGEAGLVSRRKQGREVLYGIEPGRLDQATRAMAELAAQWDRRLGTIKRLAETAHAQNKSKRRPS
jgi:hypothetical protein